MAYSDFEKLTALELVERAGGEVTASVMDDIRAALDKPKLNQATVWRWVQQAHHAPQMQNANLQSAKKTAQEQIADSLDDLFEQIAQRYLNRALDPDVIGDMKGRDLVIAAATATDKMRLLRDKSTERVEHDHVLTADERAKRVVELLDAARSRRDRSPTDERGAIH